MQIPAAPDDWTYETVASLATLGRCESERHDFKYNLPDVHGLTKIACAFANSLGGFIVVGVKERSGHFLVEGLDPDAEIAKKFADRLRSVPTIAYPSPLMIPLPKSTKVLYLFHVPRSPDRPHIPSDVDRRLFWKRTPGGCEQMNYDEIQEQFLRLEERREKLKLLFIELAWNREQLQEWLKPEAGTYSMITLDSGVIDRLLIDTYSIVQSDRRLVQILITLRSNIRITNNKTKIFFQQMALPLSRNAETADEHNAFLQKKANFLIPIITEAIDILTTRFHIGNPWPPWPPAIEAP